MYVNFASFVIDSQGFGNPKKCNLWIYFDIYLVKMGNKNCIKFRSV